MGERREAVVMTPVQLFEDGAEEHKGETARLSSFVGALAVTDLMKTTLGPKGMDKILRSITHEGELTVTNDGATILKALHTDNPAASVLVNIAKTQDDEVGDGTTSVVVFAGELLREAEKLIEQKIHPQTIVKGWRIAVEVASKALAAVAKDNSKDKEAFKKDLTRIAGTTLSSKILNVNKKHFADLSVDAVLRLKGSTNLDSIAIIKNWVVPSQNPS